MNNKTSVYDKENFFELYQKLRANPISLNEIVEKPTMLSLLPDLKGKKVGVQKGSTYETYAKEQLKMDDKNIQALTDVPSLLQDLKNKKIDAVLIPDDVAKIAMNKYTDIKISTFTADNDPEATGMAIAFKKGKNDSNKELLEQVNAVIKEIQDQKAFEKELDKYAKVAAQSE